MDLVVAACSFAGLVASQRLLSETSPATDGQVLLAGLLMIAGGAALSGELLFAVCLLAFAVLASLSLGLAVVEAAVPPGEPVPVPQVMRPLARGTVIAMLGAVAFFVLFPRLNWNMGVRRASPGLGTATSGFSDTVRLGGSGTLKSNPRVVLRAKLTPDPATEQLGSYWLGRTYDTFDGQEWSTIGAPSKRHRTRVTLRPGAEKQVYQRIELLPAYGSRTLIALETPAKLGNALAHTPTGDKRTQLQELGGDELRFVRGGARLRLRGVQRCRRASDTDPGKLASAGDGPAAGPAGQPGSARGAAGPSGGGRREGSAGRGQQALGAGCSASTRTRWSWAGTWRIRWRTSSSCARRATASTSPRRSR